MIIFKTYNISNKESIKRHELLEKHLEQGEEIKVSLFESVIYLPTARVVGGGLGYMRFGYSKTHGWICREQAGNTWYTKVPSKMKPPEVHVTSHLDPSIPIIGLIVLSTVVFLLLLFTGQLT